MASLEPVAGRTGPRFWYRGFMVPMRALRIVEAPHSSAPAKDRNRVVPFVRMHGHRPILECDFHRCHASWRHSGSRGMNLAPRIDQCSCRSGMLAPRVQAWFARHAWAPVLHCAHDAVQSAKTGTWIPSLHAVEHVLACIRGTAAYLLPCLPESPCERQRMNKPVRQHRGLPEGRQPQRVEGRDDGATAQGSVQTVKPSEGDWADSRCGHTAAT